MFTTTKYYFYCTKCFSNRKLFTSTSIEKYLIVNLFEQCSNKYVLYRIWVDFVIILNLYVYGFKFVKHWKIILDKMAVIPLCTIPGTFYTFMPKGIIKKIPHNKHKKYSLIKKILIVL